MKLFVSKLRIGGVISITYFDLFNNCCSVQVMLEINLALLLTLNVILKLCILIPFLSIYGFCNSHVMGHLDFRCVSHAMGHLLLSRLKSKKNNAWQVYSW
jgi:hypothetical protein